MNIIHGFMDGSKDLIVAVVGLGVMGTGIARAAVAGGFNVRLFDARVGRSVTAKEEILAAMQRRGEPDLADREQRLQPVSSVSDLADCGLILEAVYEDLETKSALLSDLEQSVQPGAIIASNTSSLSLTDISANMAHRGRFIGLHFFVPAHINRLVEVGVTSVTDETTLAAVLEFAAALGKTPLVCRDAPGFITNRFYLPLINEVMRLLEEGELSPGEAEAAAKEAFGLSMGPLAVCRLGKLSTTLAAVEGLSPLGDYYRPCAALRERGPSDNQWPEQTVSEDFVPSAHVISRLRGAVFLAILDALDNEVAAAQAFDTAASIGLRFGHLPCALMDQIGRDEVEASIAPLAKRHGMATPASLARVGELVAGTS